MRWSGFQEGRLLLGLSEEELAALREGALEAAVLLRCVIHAGDN